MSTKRVFLGVGHGYSPAGGGDPGACANGLKEADLNLAIALACRDELTRHGITVGLSRTNQELDPVSEEVRECNAFNPDLAVDVHFNSAENKTANGFEALVYSKGGKSLQLGIAIEKRMVGNGRRSRGMKTRLNADGKDYFAFIRDISCPSIIAEMEFISNTSAISDFDEAHEQEHWGKVLAWGILDYLGITVKNPPIQITPGAPNVSTPNTNNPKELQTTTITFRETDVICDGKKVTGYIHNGRTLCGVRELCDIIGINVDFKDSQVIITSNK